MSRFIDGESFKDHPELEFYLNLLQKVNNYGFEVLEHCLEERNNFSETLPLIPFLHKNIELTDSITTLVGNGIEESCNPLMRVLIENTFYVKYIMDENSEFRGKSYFYFYWKDEEKTLKKFLKSSQQGKDFRSKMKGGKFDPPDMDSFYKEEDVKKRLKLVRKILSDGTFKKIREEIKAFNKEYNFNPDWYYLRDGPKDIEQLASEVGLSSWYQIFYRYFSGDVHHNNLLHSRFDLSSKRPELSLPLLRTWEKLNVTTSLLVSINIEIYTSYLNHFKPDKVKEFSIWYVKNIREDFNKIRIENNP